MKAKIWIGVASVLTLTAALGTAAVAGGSQDDKAKAEMMEKWKAFGTPSEGHKVLDKMVGKWNLKTKMREEPGGPAQDATAVSQSEWIFDGRFLEEVTSGSFNDAPFVGRGFVGYDNLSKKYVMTWMDNMSTAILVSEGTYDAPTQELRFTGKCPDLKTGRYVASRMVLKLVDADHMSLRAYKPGPDGKEFVAGEIDYTRAN